MKTILALSILFSAIALPALGELTDADLDKIRLIVKDEVTKELTKELAPIKADIASIKADIGTLKEDVARLDGRLTGVEKQVSHATNVTYGSHRFPYCRSHRHPRVARQKRQRPGAKNRSTHTRNRNTQADRKPLTPLLARFPADN